MPSGTAVEFGKDGELVGSIAVQMLEGACDGVLPMEGAVPPE